MSKKLKFGVAVMTCERFDFLERTLDSLFYFNPMLEDYPLLISDDATNNADYEKMKKRWPNAHIHHYETRKGMAKNLRKLFLRAEKTLGLDLLYFCTNDVECTRKIDFKALLKFYEKNPAAGQVQFMHWKGEIGDEKRARRNKNWTTGEPIKKLDPVSVGKEVLIPANWSYTNYCQMMPLNKADICAGAVGMPNREDCFQKMELTMVRNWYNTGLQNYECQDQPFLNMDIGGKRHTEGSIP